MRWLGLLIGLGVCLPAAAATLWHIVPEQSRLGFTVSQQGGRIEGEFERFQAEIRFSPDDLADSGFEVSVDTASVDTDSRQRDRYLPGPVWFYTVRYPQARFETRAIQRRAGGGYEAVGELTIRGSTRRIALPFTWRREGDRARLQASVTIDRAEFGVGQGEWAETDAVGRQVTVIVDLTLTMP